MAPLDATDLDRQIDAVMEGSRAFVALVALSQAESEASVTLPQWRVLAIVNRYGPQNLGAIARWMGVHPSTATRTSDALVRSGLLHRREDPDDRRRLLLTLSEDGQRLVDSMLQRRRQAIENVLTTMSAGRRDRLARAMLDFADALGDAPDQIGSGAGWAH
jgi:DNA-binding MarR family transcriptional regulator